MPPMVLQKNPAFYHAYVLIMKNFNQINSTQGRYLISYFAQD
jgi:hypothetical protein